MNTLNAGFHVNRTMEYFNKSFELFHKIMSPLECLEIIVKMIKLDMGCINVNVGMYSVLGYYDD